METLMHQCRLESGDTSMIVWLSDEKSFKVGDVVTLKTDTDTKRLWKVASKGKGHPRSDIKRANFSSINDFHR